MKDQLRNGAVLVNELTVKLAEIMNYNEVDDETARMTDRVVVLRVF